MAEPSSDYGTSVANNAMSTGNAAINSFDPSAFGASYMSGLFGTKPTNLYGTQQNQQNDYISAYKSAIAANPSATQLYQTANQQYNVPGLMQEANTLNNQVLQTPQQNLNLAKGFNYDANQVGHQTSQDLTRLQPLASAATNNAQTAQTLAGQQVGYGMQQNALNLLPVQAQGQMMTDLWARQQTGFTSAMEAELNGLMSKMNAGVTLSGQEMSRANALASAQASYQSAVTSAQAQIKAAQIQQQNVSLAPGATYLNTITGKSYNPYA